jgi:predicted RNA-binding Zn-ribbon protein involved in translation (DUF1610 family)
MSSLPISQHVIPDIPVDLTLVLDGVSTHQEKLVVSNVLEAPLLKKDKEPMKAWCGNRYCKCNGSVPTYMNNGPFVHTWVAKCQDGEHREFGIQSYTCFPAYNEDGKPNRYCPYCGEELISECWDCGRKIQSGDQTHCTGCGHYLWPTYAEDQPISGDIAPLNDDSAPGSTDAFPF